MSNTRLCIGLAAALLAFAAQPAEAKILARWVQLGPDGSASARAITDEACPSAMFDGTPVAMTVRADVGQNVAGAAAGQFPVRTCEVAVPVDAVTATLEGKPLPLPRGNPRRIVMLGDTGCRLTTYMSPQSCNDPEAWPFGKIVATAAATHPDLVIHVGDYLYRETACPANQSGCAGSPWGFGWDSWNADFFDPAAPLLEAAPWAFVRGNHENCARAGDGWFRFLDYAPLPDRCRDLTGIFVARLGNFGLIDVDSANADDRKGDPAAMAAALRQQFRDVLAKIPNEAWVVTHRPFNGVSAAEHGPPGNEVDNHVLQNALGPNLPAGVRMVVSGHIHFFQAIDFGGTRPPQLVVGMGGDSLDEAPPLKLLGMDINGRPLVNGTTHARFGYMVWDRIGELWSGTLFDIHGKVMDRCRLADRLLTCGP